MFVVVEIVGTGIICHIEIEPAVIVIIPPNSAQPVVLCGIANAGLFGNVFKRSIAAIMEQEVGLALHSPGSALHQKTLVAAIVLVAARFREFVDVHVNIARYEQIDKTISIV